MKKFNRISFLKGFIIFAILFAGVYNLPIIYKKRKKIIYNKVNRKLFF